MKTITCLALSLLALGAQARPCPQGGPGAAGTCRLAPAGAVELSADEAKSLVFQVEEERMARELYAAFAAQWDLRPFHRLQAAESRHEEALRALAARAGVALPPTAPGKFAAAVLQQRHDTLCARGLISAAEARAAGEAIERQDLSDLRQLLAVLKNGAFRTVADNLARATERHLAAFSGEPGRGWHARDERPGAGCAQAGRRAST